MFLGCKITVFFSFILFRKIIDFCKKKNYDLSAKKNANCAPTLQFGCQGLCTFYVKILHWHYPAISYFILLHAKRHAYRVRQNFWSKFLLKLIKQTYKRTYWKTKLKGINSYQGLQSAKKISGFRILCEFIESRIRIPIFSQHEYSNFKIRKILLEWQIQQISTNYEHLQILAFLIH